MENNCNYSDEWQPYINDYDKFEYDIKLKDGTIVENCYPNGGMFNSVSDLHDGRGFWENEVSEIRFSENPRFGINDCVSSRNQYKYLDSQKESKFFLTNPYPFKENEFYNGKQFVCKGKHQYREVQEREDVGEGILIKSTWICECGRVLT
jgi:hypothetical protein